MASSSNSNAKYDSYRQFMSFREEPKYICPWNRFHINISGGDRLANHIAQCPNRPANPVMCSHNYYHQFRDEAELAEHLPQCPQRHRPVSSYLAYEEKKKLGLLPTPMPSADFCRGSGFPSKAEASLSPFKVWSNSEE
jgi:hypothetical protein